MVNTTYGEGSVTIESISVRMTKRFALLARSLHSSRQLILGNNTARNKNAIEVWEKDIIYYFQQRRRIINPGGRAAGNTKRMHNLKKSSSATERADNRTLKEEGKKHIFYSARTNMQMQEIVAAKTGIERLKLQVP
jgi:hypothetical protein